MNHITVTGNVGRDPELRFSNGGMAILKFSIGDTTGKDEKKKTSWHDIVVFGDQAQNVAEHVKKGSRLMIMGRLSAETSEKKDGTKAKKVEIIADEIAISVKYSRDNINKLAEVFGAEVETEDAF